MELEEESENGEEKTEIVEAASIGDEENSEESAGVKQKGNQVSDFMGPPDIH
jgi:hypothetical protein